MSAVEELNKDVFTKAEVDCVNCLSLIKELAVKNKKNVFSLLERKSERDIL
jgi:hypothetical protein